MKNQKEKPEMPKSSTKMLKLKHQWEKYENKVQEYKKKKK